MAEESKDVFLFGLGAVGAVYAYIMSQAPNVRVTVCARSNHSIVRERGMDFQSSKFGSHPNYKFHNVVSSANEAIDTSFTYVVCANKAIVTDPPAYEQIAPAVNKNTTIVLLQNGVGIEEEFQKRYPQNTIISGVVWVGATQTSPGTVVHKTIEKLEIGCHWNDTLDRSFQQRSLDDFYTVLKAGGSEVILVPTINLYRWKKTILNCTWNTLTALTLCDTSQIIEASPSGKVVARALVYEMASIARALGHIIEDDFLESLITSPLFTSPGNYSSMCVDACYERPMEVDVIVANPLRKAKELQLATPTLETICALISAMDWRFRNGVPAPATK